LCVKAHAADIYEAPAQPAYEAPPPPPSTEVSTSRAYIGQANPDVGSIFTDAYRTNTFTVFHDDIKSSPLFGLGIGWQHSNWLRFDVTGEYRGDAIFVAHDKYPGGVGFGAGTNEYTADVQSWLGLANAYIDMGNWCGITPYIGAGLGFATLSMNGLTDMNVPQGSSFFGADHTNTNFAWAIHAGVSYDVTPQFVVDLAYRYANLGNFNSGVVTAFANSSSYSGLFVKDVVSNDMMLGFRYKLQQAAPLYAVK
jgi:opacity protein-like surface antigen